jgi:hypothetical protein
MLEQNASSENERESLGGMDSRARIPWVCEQNIDEGTEREKQDRPQELTASSSTRLKE